MPKVTAYTAGGDLPVSVERMTQTAECKKLHEIRSVTRIPRKLRDPDSFSYFRWLESLLGKI